MITFIKDNMSNAMKLFVNQIAMTIFGLLLSAAAYTDARINLAAGLLSSVFYLFLLYTAAWEIGAADKIKVDGKRMEYNPFFGLYISILANALNIILAVLVVVFYIVGTGTGIVWALEISAISELVMKFINGMYVSLLSFVKEPMLNLILLAATVIPTVTASALGYYSGLKNFKFFRTSQKPRNKH